MERGRRSENESLQLPWSLSAPKYSPIIPEPTAHREQRLTALDVSQFISVLSITLRIDDT